MSELLPYINIALLVLLFLSYRRTKQVARRALRACQLTRDVIDYADQLEEGNRALILLQYEFMLEIYPRESWGQHPAKLRAALEGLEQAASRARSRTKVKDRKEHAQL